MNATHSARKEIVGHRSDKNAVERKLLEVGDIFISRVCFLDNIHRLALILTTAFQKMFPLRQVDLFVVSIR